MIEIRITSNPRFLIIVRAMVGQLCEVVECSKEEQRKIVLAVDEACANIIKHTYHFDENQPIEIVCKGNEKRLEIVLKDWGPPIDIERVQPRDLEVVKPGGLGTHFIRSIMDEVDFSHEEGCGNVLRMVKHLRTPGSEEGVDLGRKNDGSEESKG
jgi:anti-sigma regulatory factor (Ser/Thr protein kinase)